MKKKWNLVCVGILATSLWGCGIFSGSQNEESVASSVESEISGDTESEEGLRPTLIDDKTPSVVPSEAGESTESSVDSATDSAESTAESTRETASVTNENKIHVTKIVPGETGISGTPYIASIPQEDFEYGGLTLTYKGMITTVHNLYAYDIRAWYVTVPEGGEYFYIESAHDNDWRNLSIWAVSEDFSPMEIYSLDAMVVDDSIIKDPTNFTMEEHYDILSTSGVTRNYEISQDGTPAPKTEWLTFRKNLSENEYPLTVKQDIVCEVVEDSDPASVPSEGYDVVLSAGTKLRFYRTDNLATTDLKAMDGTVYRIRLDNLEEWPRTVQGIELEELFDGIVFAG